jgi:hypothetical protein
MVSINLPWGVVVSAQASARDRNPAPTYPTASRVLSRSRVDRASRSSLVRLGCRLRPARRLPAPRPSARSRATTPSPRPHPRGQIAGRRGFVRPCSHEPIPPRLFDFGRASTPFPLPRNPCADADLRLRTLPYDFEGRKLPGLLPPPTALNVGRWEPPIELR